VARVKLVDENAAPDIAALSAKIRGARGGQLHVFYRALMHTPELASAWFDFNNAVRWKTGLDDRVRELVIMRVAALNGCEYVWKVHESQYAAPAGVTPQEIEAMRGPGKARPGALDARANALLAYVDAMTRDVSVTDAAFGSLREHFSERETVDVTVLIAAYNMHTRVLMALGIAPEVA
jgi:4-carboxymuconolactone decarboxylase